jgi:sortase (surface protein transpeptidase)
VYSAAPGEEGNSIIAGHRSKNHVAGTFKALWYVEINDAVVIDFEDGSQRWFYISSINRYPFDEVDPSVMEFDGETRLTLITCIGEWDNAAGTSSERMVVVCRPGIPETGN